MRICFLPAAGAETAGARIRAFALARAVAELGHEVRIGPWPEAEVVVVQKRLDRAVLRLVQGMRKQGAAVIYDVDDSGPALAFWAAPRLFRRMVRWADLITTDTTGHRERLTGSVGGTEIVIVPDLIDYAPTEPRRLLQCEEAELRVLWFGSFSNIALFARHAATLLAMRDVRLVVITSLASCAQIAERFPGIDFLPWSVDSFTSQLATCHLSCLMHDGSEDDQAKSNNRMITSICWGVPAVVTATRDYLRTAMECRIESAVFADPDELVAAITGLRSAAARRAYLANAQDEVWRRYAPQTVARTFLAVANRALALAAARSRRCGWRQRLAARMPARLRTLVRAWRNRGTEPPVDAPREYLLAWVDPAGQGYRDAVYARQRSGGSLPLLDNPTVEEIAAVLAADAPAEVLEVGCGWGRLLEPLGARFRITGCDVSAEMLALCPPGLAKFRFDLATADSAEVAAQEGRWDVIFMRGVMLYLVENPQHARRALANLLRLARRQIHVWEWPETCAQMRALCPDRRFVYHPIEHRE